MSLSAICVPRAWRKTTSWRRDVASSGLATALLLLLLMLSMLMLLLMLIVGRDHALTDGAIMRRSIELVISLVWSTSTHSFCQELA